MNPLVPVVFIILLDKNESNETLFTRPTPPVTADQQPPCLRGVLAADGVETCGVEVAGNTLINDLVSWPEQPSVKAARRAMRAYFDQRREERRNPEAALKRRRGTIDPAEEIESPQLLQEPQLTPQSQHKHVQRRPVVLATSAFPVKQEFEQATAVKGLPMPPLTKPLTETPGIGTKRPRRAGLKPDVGDGSTMTATLVASVVIPSQTAALSSGHPEWPFADKHERRKQKNREAAATSRKRQQDHRLLMEEENKRLSEENVRLRMMLSQNLRVEPTNLAIGSGTILGDPIESLARVEEAPQVALKPITA